MRRVAAIAFLLTISVSAFAQDGGMTIAIPSARTAAVGGIHVGSTADLSSLFSNPAGFMAAEAHLSLAEISVAASGPIFDIATVVIQGLSQGDVTSMLGSERVQSMLSSIYAAADVLGPINFGYLGKGLGFGIFNTSDVTFASNAPLTLTATIAEQVTLSGGYAFRIPFPEGSLSTLDFGILLKGSMRGEIELTKSVVQLISLFDGISLETVTGEPFRFISGIGLDVGIRYGYSDIFAIGIVGKDLFTPTLTQSFSTFDAFLDNSATPTATDGLIPVDLTAGILFAPRLGIFERFINDLRFMVDYVDILDFITHPTTARNPILHASMGMEVRLLEILTLRGGFNQGLLAAGLGIELSIFNVHVAMFGTELSAEPGIQPIYNAQVSIEFRI
ncbi:MAG: hypothetical protein CMN78_05505 [Spirochaetales bacterium]|nr:hypothetical protein [Spirochaetales bacterium]